MLKMGFFGTMCCNEKKLKVVDSIDKKCGSDSVLETPPYSEDSTQLDSEDAISVVEIARHVMSSQPFQPRCSYTKIARPALPANPPDSAVGKKVVDKNEQEHSAKIENQQTPPSKISERYINNSKTL